MTTRNIIRKKNGRFEKGSVSPNMLGKKPWNLGKKWSDKIKAKCGIKNRKEKVVKYCLVCGKKMELYPSFKVGKFCSKRCGQHFRFKGKKRPELSGEKHPCWKGGITPINRKIRHSLEYKLWREAVFERDHYTCIWCGAKSGVGKKVTLNADHIKPFSLYPELRFAIDNGRTLCKECHVTTETWGRPKKVLTL